MTVKTRPLKLLKAGVVSEADANVKWIVYKHEAIINPRIL